MSGTNPLGRRVEWFDSDRPVSGTVKMADPMYEWNEDLTVDELTAMAGMNIQSGLNNYSADTVLAAYRLGKAQHEGAS